ncbi:MAG: hypothetical protein LBD11_01245 [Candidatus Peribacteria bacterium]|nr:hypothetical protein [Candidatus Peribacteria bacterium]
MMSSFPRNLLITATALLILGGISFLWAQTDDSIVNLWTNLANPVQRIKTAVFAIPDGSG